jgi:hypothetical protein
MNPEIPGFYYGESTSVHCRCNLRARRPPQLHVIALDVYRWQANSVSSQPDHEKKKYFKIQANHAAPPGAQYSQESVKRKRDEQEASRRFLPDSCFSNQLMLTIHRNRRDRRTSVSGSPARRSASQASSITLSSVWIERSEPVLSPLRSCRIGRPVST